MIRRTATGTEPSRPEAPLLPPPLPEPPLPVVLAPEPVPDELLVGLPAELPPNDAVVGAVAVALFENTRMEASSKYACA